MTAGVLRDVLSRLVRIREAEEDGDLDLFEALADDLELYLRRWIVRLEERSQ